MTKMLQKHCSVPQGSDRDYFGTQISTVWVQISEGDWISRFSRAPAKPRKINPAKFCEATPTQKHAPSLGKTSSTMALLRYFHPTTDHWRETLCVVFLCHHLFTDPQVPSHNYMCIIRKGRGNYTHNKSAKIKTYKKLIIKMFQQKREILTPRNFVPIQYKLHMSRYKLY